MIVNKQRLIYELNGQVNKIAPAQFIAIINNKINSAKLEALREFDEHPVTQELAAGPFAQNSEYINTVKGGNLFSFLGFYAGEHPERDLRRSLEKGIRKGIIRKYVNKNGTIIYEVVVTLPTMTSLGKGAITLEWINRSWVEAIEEGIPGFSNYIFSLMGNLKNSRSGSAVQVKRPIRQGRVGRIQYMSVILNNLRERLK